MGTERTIFSPPSQQTSNDRCVQVADCEGISHRLCPPIGCGGLIWRLTRSSPLSDKQLLPRPSHMGFTSTEASGRTGYLG